MNFCDINPFVRFAEQVSYKSDEKKYVFVQDCRLLYTVSGSADLIIEEQHYKFTSGSLFYCCCGNRYRIQSEGVQLIALNFDLTQQNNQHMAYYPTISLKSNQEIPAAKESILKDGDFISSYLFIYDGMRYLNDIQEILNEFATRRIYFLEKASGILKNILTDLHRHNIQSPSHSTNAVFTAISYIKEHFNQPLTNQMLADLFGYHENHLNRLFLKHTGSSIHKYILMVRLDEAKKMLLNTELSQADIAEAAGFASAAHFSSYFKKAIGFSPSEYRSNFRNML